MVLPIQLQRKLDLPRRPLEQQGSAGAGNRPGGRAADLGVRIIELRRVEHVESFGAEFQAAGSALGKCEILEQRQVHLLSARSEENVASGVSERVIARRDESARVEPGSD